MMRPKPLVRSGLFCLLVAACGGTPTQPRDTTLPTGRWTGDGACLSVAVDGCDLVVGCGHGQFAQPDVRRDGTFAVKRHCRVEDGAVGVEPGAARDVFRRPQRENPDAHRDARRSVAAACLLRPAVDERYRQVRGAVRLTATRHQLDALQRGLSARGNDAAASGLLDDATGDPRAGVASRVGLVVVWVGVNDDGGAAWME